MSVGWLEAALDPGDSPLDEDSGGDQADVDDGTQHVHDQGGSQLAVQT